jgi:hypothetical protein
MTNTYRFSGEKISFWDNATIISLNSVTYGNIAYILAVVKRLEQQVYQWYTIDISEKKLALTPINVDDTSDLELIVTATEDAKLYALNPGDNQARVLIITPNQSLCCSL